MTEAPIIMEGKKKVGFLEVYGIYVIAHFPEGKGFSNVPFEEGQTQQDAINFFKDKGWRVKA